MDFKLPPRTKISNKATYGRVLNVSGSKYMKGASYLSSISALRCGCGYLTLCSQEEVLQTISISAPEVVLAPYSKLEDLIPTSDVIMIGCGLSTSQNSTEIVKTVFQNAQNIPVIADADAINILSKHSDIILPETLILTPHPKEAARFLDVQVDKILKNTEFYAKEISKKFHATTVLKTHETIVCSKDFDIYKNTTGNSALAKAGSGDVLCGMIGGFLAQNKDVFNACKLAVYLHGLCGDLASQELSEYGVLASDIIKYIPKAIKTLL